MTKTSGKLQNVVILRSFAIIMVVLYHCICPWLKAWDWFSCDYRPIYSYIFECILGGRMPLFVAVSGYLFAHLLLDRGKYVTFSSFVKNKMRRLLIPCLLFLGLMCICFNENYWDSLIGYGFHLWFLKMLFVSFMVSWPILKFVHDRWLLIVFVLSVILTFTPPVDFFALQMFQKFYVFFLGGAILYRFRDIINVYSYNIRISIIGTLYISLLIIILWRYIIGDASGDIINTDEIVHISRLLLFFVTVFLAFSVVDCYIYKNSNLTFPKLNKFNRLSFGIYLFHIFYIQLFHQYFDYRMIDVFGGPLIFFIIIMGLSIISAKLVNKTRWGSYLIG